MIGGSITAPFGPFSRCGGNQPQGPTKVLSVSGTLSRGLGYLGARPGPLSDAEFTKVNARADASLAVGPHWRVSGGAMVQASDDRLPVTEQATLGGSDFGRGFGAALIAGDRGWAVKAEVAWRPEGLPQPVRGSEVYVFADRGEVTLNDRPAFPERTLSLASAGAGVRVALRSRTVVELEAARTVDDPRPGRPDDWRFGAGLSTRF